MKYLRIAINNKIATYVQRDGAIVCGNKGYTIAFTFDAEWDEYPEKTARFIWNGKYYDQEFTGTECSVPVINDTTEVTVGVYAGDIKTTTPAVIPCLISILCGEQEAIESNIKQYRDIAQEAAAEAKQAAEQAVKAAEVVVQPVITVEDIEGGHRVTVKDIEGEKPFDVTNGKDGTDGNTPYIGENGNWWIGETDTGVVAGGSGTGSGLTEDQIAQFNAMLAWYEEQTYKEMTLTLSPANQTYELGSKQTVKFSWSFSKEVSKVTFNGEAQEATPNGSKTVENITATSSYRVEGVRAGGKQETKGATRTISFCNRFYWGYAADPRDTGGTLDDVFIKSLPATGSKGFASGRSITFNITCDSGTYIWYAYPTRLGAGTISMAPRGSTMYFEGGFEAPEIVNVTNDSKYAEDYFVYRSINPALNQSVKVT